MILLDRTGGRRRASGGWPSPSMDDASIRAVISQLEAQRDSELSLENKVQVRSITLQSELIVLMQRLRLDLSKALSELDASKSQLAETTAKLSALRHHHLQEKIILERVSMKHGFSVSLIRLSVCMLSF
jgi:hypothetical protein